MDYVPDVAAFKVIDFKGADSYLCVVCTRQVPLPRSILTRRAGQAQAYEAVLYPAV